MKSYQIRIALLVNLCLFGVLGFYLYQVSTEIDGLRQTKPAVALQQGLSNEQYVGVLIQMGQLDQASSLVETLPVEMKKQIIPIIDKLQEKKDRAVELIIVLSQHHEQVQQQSSWGWVKFEKVEVIPKDMQLQYALQMAFISANMGFLGWDKVVPVLQSCADQYPQKSDTYLQLKQLIMAPEGEQDV